MKLFSKHSNHDTSTPQTDGRTTCRSNSALCVALRGKNIAYHLISLYITHELSENTKHLIVHTINMINKRLTYTFC